MFEANSSLKFFSKMWLLAAQLETRQSDLSGARAILGKAIGLAPKHKIFKNFIEIELRLVELERSLNEIERTISLFELVIAQPAPDMPELWWKEYIDFDAPFSSYFRKGNERKVKKGKESNIKERKVDNLFCVLNFALFEATAFKEVQQGEVLQEQRQLCILRVKRVFENAIDYYKTSAPELKEERDMLQNCFG
ncbi:crooked neck-like protein 1 [Tanacetum coccineum]